MARILAFPKQSAVDTFHLAIRSLGPTAMLRDWERDGRLEELAALIDRGTPFTDIETYLRTVKGGA